MNTPEEPSAVAPGGHASANPIEFDPQLIARYDRQGPRYTSYPTAVQFTEEFGAAQYRAAHAAAGDRAAALSLYVHLPFCNTICFYCACNKVVTRHHERAVAYLERLYREIDLQADVTGAGRRVSQLHFGGGTPTFCNDAELAALLDRLRTRFDFDPRGEYSIEVDPRTVDGGRIAALRQMGFNRLSMGIQDFDPRVQRAVNRIHDEASIADLVGVARASGFHSLSMDLIYGLPLQNVASFEATLATVIGMRPDRLSVFNYAHLPELFKPQRRIDAADLPDPATKLAIMQRTIDMLGEAGYVYIGMDHFALPGDELVQAQRNGTLQRNFQGYSTHGGCVLLGLGISAIGMTSRSYAQNLHDLDGYYAALDRGHLPLRRGIALSRDDLVRRAAIMSLACSYRLDYAALEATWGVSAADYFAAELAAFAPMQADGLVELGADALRVLPRGRLLIRNLCMVFDRYLAQQPGKRFSKVI